jgi:hypothetical protein
MSDLGQTYRDRYDWALKERDLADSRAAVTDAHQPGHMVTGQKHNRLNGHCPDLARCSLLPLACSLLCWRMEGDLIEAARAKGAKTAGDPVRPARTISTRAGKNSDS